MILKLSVCSYELKTQLWQSINLHFAVLFSKKNNFQGCSGGWPNRKRDCPDNQVWKIIFYFELAVPHQKSIVACISIRFCTTSSKNIPKIISFSKLLTYSQFKNYTITYSEKLPNIKYWNLKRGWLQFVWKYAYELVA